MSIKSTRLAVVVAEAEALMELMNADAANVTPENEAQFKSLLAEGEKLQTDIKAEAKVLGLRSFLDEPVAEPKLTPKGGDGADAEPFTGSKSLGTTFIENETYQRIVKSGIPKGSEVRFELKGVKKPSERKATFDTATTGLTGNVNYLPGIVMVEQQRLTVADLFAQGETTTNVVNYIKETSFTNAADTVAEGAEKPEATFATEPASAPVKKIAVVAKITDEMFADFPQMRDYVNNRLVFMVEAKEEQQLISGTGSGSQITGVLNVSGIQTEALGGSTVPDAILNAITKVRTVGFFEPDAIVVHPNDWRDMKKLKDDNQQYYFGGPFSNGAYGAGVQSAEDRIWGLRVVVTTAITEGTALVGAFKMGGQVFRRDGITVATTNTNEDDFNFNRSSIRVEERLALAVYRPLAFCKVTGI